MVHNFYHGFLEPHSAVFCNNHFDNYRPLVSYHDKRINTLSSWTQEHGTTSYKMRHQRVEYDRKALEEKSTRGFGIHKCVVTVSVTYFRRCHH